MKQFLFSIGLMLLGVLLVSISLPAQQYATQAATISFSGSGSNTIVTAIPGKAIRVSWFWLCVGGATNITVNEVRPGVNSGAVPMTTSGCMTLPSVPNGSPVVVTAVGNGFVIQSSSAVQVSGAAYYDVTNN